MSAKSHAEVMRMVAEDCAADARALDSTPFTPRGIGEALGNILAQVAAIARAVEALHLEAESAETKSLPSVGVPAGDKERGT